MAFPVNIAVSDLNGTDGFIINGVLIGDRVGWSVSDAGDMDGDGFDDVIISGKGAFDYESKDLIYPDGDSYVVFGGPTVGAGGSFDLSSLDGANGFIIRGVPESESGHAVSAAGDFNKDGYADVIIGAPRGNETLGQSYIVFGGPDVGSTGAMELSALALSEGFTINGAHVRGWPEYAGASVSAAGDFNGDLIDDVIIGAPYADTSVGRAYVVFGQLGPNAITTLELSTLQPGEGFVISGPLNGAERFGLAVGGAGDFNGDGIDDVIVGAPFANGGVGTAYVVFGSKDHDTASFMDVSALDGTNGFVIQGVSADDRTGVSVSAAGDVNGDSFDDLIVGANRANEVDGASYVLFGRDSLDPFDSPIALSDIDGTNGFVIAGQTFSGGTSSQFGTSVSAAGDVDGDGIDDLIVGAFGAGAGSSYAGASYVVLGKAGLGSTGSFDLADIDGTNGFVLNGSKDIKAGSSVSAAGDVNGDDLGDLIVGTKGPEGEPGRGYVVFGIQSPPLPPAPPPPPVFPWPPAESNRAPVAGDDAYTTHWSVPLSLTGPGLRANDTDADGDPLTVTDLLSGPSHGVLSWSADGGFTYTLNVVFSGTDGFSYAISDGRGGTDTADVLITITDTDAPPPRPDVTGGFGDERFWGTNRADDIRGMGGDDTITGDGGDDELNGNAGDDVVNGQADDDLVHGGKGNDWALGGSGRDTVHGDAGDDQVWGGGGNDQVFGDAGDDVLHGDLGNDTLTGGPGDDHFAFGDASGVDRIADFDPDSGDFIRLEVGVDGTINDVAFGSFQDILAHLGDGPNGVVLDLGGGNSVTIAGIAKADLAAGDFMIV